MTDIGYATLLSRVREQADCSQRRRCRNQQHAEHDRRAEHPEHRMNRFGACASRVGRGQRTVSGCPYQEEPDIGQRTRFDGACSASIIAMSSTTLPAE